MSGKFKVTPLVFIISILLSWNSNFLLAQSESGGNSGINPVRELIERESAIATYEIPNDIFNNLSKDPGALKRPGEVKKPVQHTPAPGGIHKLQGYRIQVFSDGRNPSTLQSRANARGNAIVSKFPKYRGQVYSFSSSPNWYTRIGNFRTMKEANEALAELKKAFPSFAAEMRIVKSSITIIK